MKYKFLIDVEVERVQGKFASKDDIADKIMSDIESCDPGTVYSDDDAEYNVVSWDVSVE